MIFNLPSPTSPKFQQLLAILFVASEPLTPERVAEIMALEIAEIDQLVSSAEARHSDAALHIQQDSQGLRVVTNPAYAPLVRQVFKLEGGAGLSRSAKETLAIIAYQQPVDRTGLEKIRGLDCRRTLNSLMQKGLIQQSQTHPEGGDPRAFYYEVSPEFLEYFGLASVEELRGQMKMGE